MNHSYEFRQGWGVVLASTVGIMGSCITLVNYSLGVFVIPLNLAFGWSRHDIMFATSCVTLGALFTSFVTGWLSDKIATGLFIVLSQIGFGLVLIAIGLFADSLRVFYSLHVLIAVVTCGTLPITFTKIVASRFARQRGLALGLALAGTGLTGFLIPPYVAYFVNHFGWRVGYFAVAAVPLVLGVPLSLRFLRNAHSGPAAPTVRTAEQHRASDGLSMTAALCSWRFWALAAAVFLASGASTGISANMVPMMVDRGFAPQSAANLAAVYGLAVIAGRIAIGALADRFWAPLVAFAFLAPAAAASIYLAIMPTSVGLAVIAISVVGLATGAEGDLLSYLVTRYFGIRAYGKIFSGIFVAFIAAIALAAPFFGFTYDQTRSYGLAMNIVAAGWLACAVLFLALGRYPVWVTPAARD